MRRMYSPFLAILGVAIAAAVMGTRCNNSSDCKFLCNNKPIVEQLADPQSVDELLSN